LNLPDHHGQWRKRIPTQVLEIIWTTMLLIAALTMRSRAPFAGATFCYAVIAYAVVRCFLQTLRADETGGRATAIIQATSMFLALAAVRGLFLALSG
jgi:prolipoprotein diacylglyceryltransferase